jgi:hypothetical protein
MKTRTIIGAAAWASYFINDDSSGLEPAEIEAADCWLALELEPGECVIDCSEEPWFTWAFDLHTHTDVRGGNVVDYTIICAEEV